MAAHPNRPTLHEADQVNAMLLIVLLVLILVIASVIDIRWHRLPNWLTYPAMLLGIGLHTLSGGFGGFLFGLGGLALGLGLLLIFYLLGGMGAGDVKLMAAVGAFLGPKGVFVAFIFTALVGGLYALALLIRSGRFGTTVVRVGAPLMTFLGTRTDIGLSPAVDEKAPKLCYGVAIAVGTVVSIVSKGYLW